MRPNIQCSKKRKYLSGMTLLEVLVALFIFALTGTAIMKAASDHLTGVGQIEDITFATWVANNHLMHGTGRSVCRVGPRISRLSDLSQHLYR